MAFDLKSIRSTKRLTPWRLLIHGEHKIGKTTFAAGAEGAIFLPTEDGQDNVEAATFDLITTWDDLLAAIGTLYCEEHGYLTAVLDSADWAEMLCHRYTCKTVIPKGGQVKKIEDFGYGKGYVYAAEIFREMLDGLNALRMVKGMNVIILAHSEIRRFDDPLADSYDRYQIKMHKLISKLVQEWADIIGFAQLSALTRTEDQGFGKKKTRALDGERVLRLQGSAAYDAGNRYGLPESIPLNFQSFDNEMRIARGEIKNDSE